MRSDICKQYGSLSSDSSEVCPAGFDIDLKSVILISFLVEMLLV